FFSSRRRHTRSYGDWSSDVCSSDLNMDYNGLREGVTVYLPVYQEGAILFVGDGHAVEGDGELNGDALETSMDVEFTVNLVRGQEIGRASCREGGRDGGGAGAGGRRI